MNTVHPLHMDPRCVPIGFVRTPGMMVPPIIGRHQLVRGRMPHPGLGGVGPGPPQLGGPGVPGHNIYVEDQMDHLAGKLDMLENELRYAWRALDVLSQEYIKMWERMEKLEGLLTEQQTVITQLIDLYTADSSDNAENEFESNGRDISNFQSFGGKAPDESFYKALNMVHQNSYPNTSETLAISNFNTANVANVEKSPKSIKNSKPQQKTQGPREIEYIDNFNIANTMVVQQKMNNQVIREDSEGDLKSMSSSVRSTQSGMSDVAEFPVPPDTSPTYENLMSAGTLVTNVANSGPGSHKRKLPQLPHNTADNRRTRKDGLPYGGDQALMMVDPNKSDNSSHGGSTQSVTNVFTGSGPTSNVQNEISYDTYPRRKKKKDKQQKKGGSGNNEEISADSPLTVIDGNYSFNISGDPAGLNKDPGQQQPSSQARSGMVKPGQTAEAAEDRMNKPRETVKAVEEAGGKQIKIPPGGQVQSQGKLQQSNQSQLHQQQQQQSGGRSEDTQSDNSLTRASANSLFQQIHAHEAQTGQSINKGRKLSLKEKRKLRAERDLTEFLPKSVEVEEPPNQAPVLRKPDHSNSESDVSMRSDISPKRDSDDIEPLLAANGMPLLDQQGSNRTRSNGMNLMPPPAAQQQSKTSNSREFAVSRALGKYRQKKKERESSNSDSQDELEIGCDGIRSSAGIESTLKSLDAKLAEIEESVEPVRSISVTDANSAIPSYKVQNQLNKFEEAGLKPIELANKPMSRKVSEDSIDTDDEWYRHEMMRLRKMESEQKAGGIIGGVIGELNRKLVPQDVNVQDISKVGQPPDRPPGEPPDKKTDSAKRIQRRSSKKQLHRKSTSEKSTEDNDDSSVTGSADDDSETQSGEDFIDEEDDYAQVRRKPVTDAEPVARPGNLTIQQSQPLNISGLPYKPDLLEELTAAAAEDHYPEHLKHGYFGEDGIWYDEHGETGYWGEDGEWYDYMDEIGYYDDGGEWCEYDYSKGYWDDEGEWKLKDSPTKPTAAVAGQNPGKEADHFLWVSEEGTNEFANDQVPSSELTTRMVIGKPASGFTEDLGQHHLDKTHPGHQHHHGQNHLGHQHLDQNHLGHQHLDQNQNTNVIYSEREEVLNQQIIKEPLNKSTTSKQTQDIIEDNHVQPIIEDEADDRGGGGGGRWGTVMQKMLVRH